MGGNENYTILTQQITEIEIMIFSCGNISSGNQVHIGGSISDFGCSYMALSPESSNHFSSISSHKQFNLDTHVNGFGSKSIAAPISNVGVG